MKRFINTGSLNLASRWLNGLLPVSVVLLALIVWEICVHMFQVPAWILPAPTDVFSTLIQDGSLILYHAVTTIKESILGLLLATAAAIILAVFLDSSQWVRKAFYPLLITSQTIPIIALAPLFLIWFGYGMLPKVLIVALVCFFPIAVNVSDGFRETDPEMLKLLKANGAKGIQIFWKVKLPSSLPFFFSGMRIAATYSVMGSVIGEWLGGSRGLGIQLIRAAQSYRTDLLFAIIVVIVMLSLLVFSIVELLSRVMMPWNDHS